MTGLYLQQLLTACLGLKDTLNSALATVDLDQFVTVTDPTGVLTWSNQRPCLLIDTVHDEYDTVSTGGPSLVVEKRRVSFEAFLDCTPADAPFLGKALAYEGVLATTLNAQFDTIREAIIDETVEHASPMSQWRLLSSAIAIDEERANVPMAWRVTLEVGVWLEWP